MSLLSTTKTSSNHNNAPLLSQSKIDVENLWGTVPTGGWRPSYAPRSDWPLLAARIMNATLVLPELDANSFWHDDRYLCLSIFHLQFLRNCGFHGIYDVEHFINSLRYDARIVESIPEIRKNGKTKKLKAFQAKP